MTRTLSLFACLGLLVAALGCGGSRHGVCDCDAPPAAHGNYGAYGLDGHDGGHGHIAPVPVAPGPVGPESAGPGPVAPGY